jgi:hypothetical protein
VTILHLKKEPAFIFICAKQLKEKERASIHYLDMRVNMVPSPMMPLGQGWNLKKPRGPPYRGSRHFQESKSIEEVA